MINAFLLAGGKDLSCWRLAPSASRATFILVFPTVPFPPKKNKEERRETREQQTTKVLVLAARQDGVSEVPTAPRLTDEGW